MKPLARVLASKAIWKLSGISYATAVLATRGRLEGWREYLRESRAQMDRLPVDVHDKRVMEFGCGLGGNLLAVSENIRYGVGVDVNRGFLRIAAQLCRKAGVRNLSFIWYDGKTLPPLGLFELVFSIGVFERLPKEQVRSYVEHLKKVLVPEGKLVLYFLTDSAKNSDFSRRLGPESYVYWSEDQLRGLFGDCHMRVEATHDWSPYSVIYVVQ